jgi:cell division septal protein FtsQ
LAIDRMKYQRQKAMKAVFGRVIAVFVFAVLIVASLYLYDYLTTSGRFAIREVEIEGLARADTAEVRRLLADLEGQNILLAPLDSYADRLRSHPRIESASLERTLPGKVTCLIEEREPVLVVFTDRYYEVDPNGMVMTGDAYTPLLDLPLVRGLPKEAVKPGAVSVDPRLRNALEALQVCRELGGDFAEGISELESTETGVTIRSTQEDWVLLLGDSDYENRLRKFFLLRDTLVNEEPNARLIDLRFDHQVVVRAQI